MSQISRTETQKQIEGKNEQVAEAVRPNGPIEADIEQAIAPLITGDFHSKWSHTKQFSKEFSHLGDRPISSLIHHLHSSLDPENQWFLIRTLGQYDHPIVVEAIANFLTITPVEALQLEATKALTSLGNSAIATLTHLLNSDLSQQKILAARTLAKIRRSAVIEPLLGIVEDPSEALRAIAIEALGSFHDPRVTPVLLNALNDEPPIAVEAVRALGRRFDLLATTDLMARLHCCLQGAEVTVACESAIALGRLGGRSGQHAAKEFAAESLGKFLMQPAASRTKVAAVRALGWLETPTATLHLTTAFARPFPLIMPEVRQEIGRSLGQTRSTTLKPIAAQPLINWLQKQNANLDALSLKQTVISALARLGAVDAIDSLIPLLADADARIKMNALSALKQIDPKAAQAKIQNYLLNEAVSRPLKADITDTLKAW
ncbi:MAG: HEAT repeat domain-containing protein [Phormidesmis sp.]